MTKQAPIRTRSWLFTPATRPERFAKASQAGADVAILDLEDAVAPGDKVRARNTALDYLAGNPSDGTLHALRINGLDTRTGISDLDALLGSKAAPDFLVLPKTETAGHLEILDRLLTAAGKATRLIGLIESARGLAAVEAIAAATPRLAGLMLGAADMAADLGATMAEAVGIRGIRIEDPAKVEDGIAAAFAHDGPVLIDAVVNRTELAMPPSVTVEMAKGFSLYMVKAIIGGRADEVIDLAKTNLWR